MLKDGIGFIDQALEYDKAIGKINADLPKSGEKFLNKVGNRTANPSHKFRDKIMNSGQKIKDSGQELYDTRAGFRSIADAMIGIGDSTQKTASAVSSFSTKVRKKAGKAINETAEKVGKHEKGIGFDLKGAIAKDVKLHTSQVLNFAGSLVEETDKNLLGIKLNGRGKIVAAGAALVGGSAQGVRSYNQKSMGARDGQITGHTPTLPAYANNAGATGDLVFALNANRRG